MFPRAVRSRTAIPICSSRTLLYDLREHSLAGRSSGSLRDRLRPILPDLATRLRFTACPAQLDTINLRKKTIVESNIRRKVHGIGVAADHVRKMPVRIPQDGFPGQHRDLQRMHRSNTARTLKAVGNAIEFEPYRILGHALDREFDLAEAEGGIVLRALGVEIERADLAVRARTKLDVLRNQRVGSRRRAWRQPTERAELAIGIAARQRLLPNRARAIAWYWLSVLHVRSTGPARRIARACPA